MRLTLKKDTLSELTAEDLRAVVGAGHTLVECLVDEVERIIVTTTPDLPQWSVDLPCA